MKLFGILSCALTLSVFYRGSFTTNIIAMVEGLPLGDGGGGNDNRPGRKLKKKHSKHNPPPKKVLLGYYEIAELKTVTKRFAVGSTLNIPEVNGDPKCQESGLGPDVVGFCVGDVMITSGCPIYSDHDFQNKIAVAYDTSTVIDVFDPTYVSIDSSAIQFVSTDDEDGPSEIHFGGLSTYNKRIVSGGFGKYEGATGRIEFEYLADNKAGAAFAVYHRG